MYFKPLLSIETCTLYTACPLNDEA